MYISYNSSAVLANNALNKTDNRLTDSLQRLSSGLKIANPKDNPSGLAMAKRMNSQLRGITQATQNSNDAISVIEIADGTMSEIAEMLQRMNELAVKGATGSLTEDDRKMIDEEMQQLKDEITRISEETSFNGQTLLDGSFDLRGYTDNTNVKVAYYGDDVVYGKYSISGLDVSFNGDLISDLSFDPDAMPPVPAISDANGSPIKVTAAIYDGNTVTLSNNTGFELKLEVYKDYRSTAATTDTSNLTIDLTGFGAMDMQIGANEGQQLAVRIPKISLENMGISNIKTSADYDDEGNVVRGGQDYSNEAIEKIRGAIQYLSSARSNLGAYQNRLEHTTSMLSVTNESMTSAYSRIMDVDMAEEMTEYTTLQVMSQASTSMLAQANERPSQVLQLLQ
ncbi:MAG: flagellin [Lachnospiraceae bacterium]|nr:flagellin [Lachnospiraceae bacterium]